MAHDPEIQGHLEWLGYVQPVGLVVSIPALLSAQAHVNRNIAPEHAKFLACLPRDKDDEPIPEIRDFAEFTRAVLDWRDTDLEPVVAGDPRHTALEVHLPEYRETLRPTWAVREQDPKDAAHPWILLIQSLPAGAAFDSVQTTDETQWQATPQARFERLLRETKVPIGLLASPTHLRLVYAPRGETSGYLTFGVAEMAQVAGRPIFAALHMLLSGERLFSLDEKQRLPAILADSRKYQNHVSNELAQQLLAALYELLRGFQAANDATNSALLRDVLAADPNHVYGGLLTVLMRLVFILYAEDRDLLSSDAVYTNHYSVTGLFERLRADEGRHPDTMDQRYGAWAQLLTLFRLIHEGGSHGGLRIPARQGYLFDPDRYNFLEGRSWKTLRGQANGETPIPRVPDGVIFRVLRNLLILDGERLSYRTLDVEQIGSVYETMMGFEIELAGGRSIAIKPKKSHGAPATINLETLLAAKPPERAKLLKEITDQEMTGQAATALKEAKNVEDLLTSLDRKIAKNVTPNVVSKGSMVFQPSDERRKSGSHYTPRTLTEPIVRTTLKPILEQLGEKPTPEQLLNLKVCDPAMGSGAFLVEACRQLGDELIKAWHFHKCVPKLPPDEDEVLHARRLVAQRCLYGVDKNPMAVDLSKLSLWLATLAKDHPFTFLDHSLRCGDSLVGLSREQIAAFHWQPKEQKHLLEQELTKRIARATEARRKILTAPESIPYATQQQALAVADEALDGVRRLGDLVIAAFFSADKPKARESKLGEYLSLVTRAQGKDGRAEDIAEWLRIIQSLHGGDHRLTPFHWQIEFPEVFDRAKDGFDALIGNPPFLGGTRISASLGGKLRDWLLETNEGAHGNADFVTYFFRLAFLKSRAGGVFGFIATNTIGQGDSRNSGLGWIVANGGIIFCARKRIRWPGQAAVIISVVHVANRLDLQPRFIDLRECNDITAYLFHTGSSKPPAKLAANELQAFSGVKVYGQGFLFDDADPAANSIAEMKQLIATNPHNSERIFPYMGGEEINESATLQNTRYAFSFEEMSLAEAKQWPELLAIAETRVKPARAHLTKNAIGRKRASSWWIYGSTCKSLYAAIDKRSCVIACSQTSKYFSFAIMPSKMVFSHKVVVFALSGFGSFGALQSRIHTSWAEFQGSSMKDDPVYTPSDCFETFPFPVCIVERKADSALETERSAALESSGREYYEFRAALMIRNNEGLTKTYNRFHDPEEKSPDILKLRELHAAMDRAVLEAYGWNDLAETAMCEFLLDYEEDEDDESSGKKSKRKKPWRYRWPDDFRDEVLARLLELNKQRAEEERLAGIAKEGVGSREVGSRGKKKGTKKASGATPAGKQNRSLPGMD